MMSRDGRRGIQRREELHLERAGDHVVGGAAADMPAPRVVAGPPGERLPGAEGAGPGLPAPGEHGHDRLALPGYHPGQDEPGSIDLREAAAAGRTPNLPSWRWPGSSTLAHGAGRSTRLPWSASRPRTSMARRWQSRASRAAAGLPGGSAPAASRASATSARPVASSVASIPGMGPPPSMVSATASSSSSPGARGGRGSVLTAAGVWPVSCDPDGPRAEGNVQPPCPGRRDRGQVEHAALVPAGVTGLEAQPVGPAPVVGQPGAAEGREAG